MTLVNPLDLKTWFLVTFAGSIGIFVAMAFVFIAALSARFRMPQSITLLSFVLFAVFLGAALGEFFIAAILIIGLVSFWGLARLFTR